MIPSVGGTEILILLVIVLLLLFGAKRIPELARGLGSGVKEFREGISGRDEGQEEEQDRGKKEEILAGKEAPSEATRGKDARTERVGQEL